mmetsp:Transcript_68355/g.142483  ORF Transcript_68355/g.142483 Transcript_68355/m.142483 type:complete len:396 (-) Transcript_68355:199-1386(-)|eukprot:CAMPEP_0181317642 /NCGR_PEP_ID=MMETSP1101-20121128/16581_1 /TAXON_ID=46948 /ORGANISM="Rhodomonas abbreviata, Strain Caron Lab Isolate" /LENGTH=395 /DNA_ID=CAMNT_0023425057 /DNA_START=134 /DNA_END=1321 /DNA_ORIENTATION=+
MERLLAAPPQLTCITDSVLVPCQALLEFTVSRVISRKELRQLIVVASERPRSDFQSWAKVVPGADRSSCCKLGFVDCFSDPCGWLEPLQSIEMSHSSESGVSIGELERRATSERAIQGSHDIETARIDSSASAEGVLSAVKKLIARASEHDDSKGSGNKKKKVLVLFDSVASFALRGGVPAIANLLYELSSFPQCCVMFVLHSDLLSVDDNKALSYPAQCVITTTKPPAPSLPLPELERGGGGSGGGEVKEEARGKAGAKGERVAVCGVELLKKRENGTVSSRADILYRILPSQVLVAEPDLTPSHLLPNASSPSSATPFNIGVSFKVASSEKDKEARAALLLPFQRHLNLSAPPVEDRGFKTSGDMEDALQVLEDEEEEEEDDDDEDPDDDLDI